MTESWSGKPVILVDIEHCRIRAFLKRIKTPINLSFSARTAPIFLAIRQYGCKKSACLSKKTCVSVHSATFQKRSRIHKSTLYALGKVVYFRMNEAREIGSQDTTSEEAEHDDVED